LADALFGQGVR
jgi:hypothetical protein